MSTRIIFKPRVATDKELEEEFGRTVANGVPHKHAELWSRSRHDAEYSDHLANGKSIPDGPGDHRETENRRDSKYGHFSYHVVEGA